MEESVFNNSSTCDDKSISTDNSDNDGNDNNKVKRRFISWGQCKSRDANKPDILEVRPQSRDIYSTEFSQCTDVSLKEGKKEIDAVLALKSLSSPNASLLNQWKRAFDKGLARVGKLVKILTWLDTSKNGNPIRRFRLVIL